MKSKSIKRLVLLAMFVAVAYALQFVFRIKVQFLTFDAKDAVLTIGAMICGPISAITMSTVIGVMEFFFISDTGFWGMLMNILGSIAFSFTASAIYKFRRTFWGAIIGLSCSVVVMIAVMLVSNLLITPIYTGMAMGDVAKMIPALLLPFNFAKAIFNAALVLILYKPMITALRRAKLIPSSEKKQGWRLDRNTLWMILLAIVFIAIGVGIFLCLDGSFILG